MKVDRLETHDRLVHFQKQEFDIGKTVQDIINCRPFGDHAFYIFAHKREIGLDERVSMFNQDMFGARQFKDLASVPNARIIWQPRLTKPEPQENSMLFKAYPGTDIVKTIWIIPQRELWEQFEKEKMTGSELIWECIEAFKHKRKWLAASEDDDPSDDECSNIYQEVYGNKYIKI